MRKPNRFRPNLENLEGRQLLAAKITAILDQGVLQIVGTEKNDKIEVSEKNGNIEVTGTKISIHGEKKSKVSADLVERIVIDVRGGNDRITMVSKKGIAVSKPAKILAGAGDDVVLAGSGDDSIFAGPGNDIVSAGSGADKIYGGDGNDTLMGGWGDDELSGGNGVNALDGGAGVDTIFETGSRLLLSDATLETSPGVLSKIAFIEKAVLLGTAGDDYINARRFSGRVDIAGLAGNDVLVGGLSADRIVAGPGNDYVAGGPGSDQLSGDAGDDYLFGGDGDDELYGDDGNDELTGGAGFNTLDGGDGVDRICETGDRLLLSDSTVETSTAVISNLSSLERATLKGTQGDDYINARWFSGSVEIFAFAGDDVLVGGMSADRISGGAGNDYLAGGPGDDILFAEMGDDYLFGGDGNDELFGGAGFDHLSGGEGYDLTLGESDDDLIDQPRERWTGGGYSLLDVQKMRDYVPNQPAVAGMGDLKPDQYDDVFQVFSPSCFFAAALSAYARTASPASRIRFLGNNQYGVTLFRPEAGAFPKQFTPVEIVVSFDGTWDSSIDLKPSPEGDFWPTLYQRAFRVLLPEYNTPRGGPTEIALMALTGKPNFDFQGQANQLNALYGKAPDQGSRDIRFIADALKSGNPVTAGTYGSKTNPTKTVVYGETGIVAGHAYTVVEIQVLNGGNDALVTLRNPWGVDTNPGVRYSDSINGDTNDGLVRIPWSTFQSLFLVYVIGQL